MHDCGFNQPCVELKIVKGLSLLYLQAILVELLVRGREVLVILVLL
uniref:Uncharacterized protein n=1 Tax=Rhizophora mucronata TaxID=61149 RepID=A0A2P2PBY9_RHIMU